ncbi:MAG: YchJ family protein [Kiritimatiellia bacterium]
MSESLCPCGSGLSFDACCGGILGGKRVAETAEQLMRARYSAYVTENIDYLRHSLVAADREGFDSVGARNWSQRAMWQGLEVLAVERGAAGDADGLVEFVARYQIEDVGQAHHERARFVRESGVWCYAGGRVIGVDPYRREEPKVGRNLPCPCGSGKKHKKCCGR